MNRIGLVFSLACVCSGCVAEPGSIDYDRVKEADARGSVERAKSGKAYNVLKSKEAVPNKKTAIALAVAVWSATYGKEMIARDAPYQAIRVDDCWLVLGRAFIGSRAVAIINAADGRFLAVSHAIAG